MKQSELLEMVTDTLAEHGYDCPVDVGWCTEEDIGFCSSEYCENKVNNYGCWKRYFEWRKENEQSNISD